MRKLAIAAACGVLALASGCATVTRGTMQEVTVTSHPSGAKIYVDNVMVATTPANVNVTRDSNHVLRVELEGYAPYEIPLNRSFGIGWAVLDVLLFWPGIIVDVVTGEVVGTTPDGRGNRLRFVELDPRARRALEAHLELFQQPTRIGPPPLVPGSQQGRGKRVLEGIIIVENDPAAREFRLRSSDKLMGRDPRLVDFVLDHPSVSRRHAHIICHQGRHIINDLSSTNGIHFRGKPVRSLVLRDGMVFRVGKVRLQYLVTREV